MNYPFPKEPSQKQISQQQQLMQMIQNNPELLKKYQEELQKMKSKSNTSTPPMTSEKYLQQLPNIQKFFDQQGGITIVPKERFVLKFFQKKTNQKIFVNILAHPVIDHPQQKLLVDFQNQPGLRIPMSMGRVRQDSDKTGNICKVVDVILNPKIIDTMDIDAGIMNFTAQIIGNYLLQKYKIVIADDRMKKVKGLKYKGNKVEIQRVKGKKNPKIQQLSQQISPEQQKKQEQLLNQIHNPTEKKLIKPQFKVWAYDNQNRCEQYSLDSKKELSKLKIILELPHLLNSKGIHLEASSRFLYMFVKGIYEICLKIPFEVDRYNCKFAKRDRKLSVFIYPLLEKEESSEKGINQFVKETNVEFENDLLDQLV